MSEAKDECASTETNRNKSVAFTLAELLITLTIVGVVAALILPGLISDVQMRVKAQRVQNIRQKISKATDKMLALNGMNGYSSTEDFVNELKNHLAISKICKNDNLKACWPYNTIILTKDYKQTVNVAQLKTPEMLKMSDNETHEWDDTVGILIADGTPMILSYNKKCDMNQTVTPIWNGDSSTSANCVAAVFDWNGGKGPNLYSNLINGTKADVISLNSNGLHTQCALITGHNKCFGMPFKSPKVEEGTRVDYWKIAVDACGGTENMPDAADGAAIASLIYGVELKSGDLKHALTPNKDIVKLLGFESSWIWSGVEYSNNHAYVIGIGNESAGWFFGGNRSMNHSVICKIK